MRLIEKTIAGIDGSLAEFTGYIIENSDEMHPNRRRPAILILPGGGYSFCSDREADPIALAMLGFGFHAFILRYSCEPSRYPVQLIEAAQAVADIRANAAQWHVDPNAIVVAGFSAGGHLAANLGVAWNTDVITDHGLKSTDVKPNGLFLGYPVISSGPNAHQGSFELLLGDKKDDLELRAVVSHETRVSPDTPPTFMWHTATDETVPVENTFLFSQALCRAGVPVEVHIYPSGAHGLSLGNEETSFATPAPDNAVEPAVQSWPKLFARWVDATFPTRDFA